MERFVRLVVGGGVALVAGLWVASVFGVRSLPGAVGAATALVGAGALLAGIGSELEW